MANFIPIDLTNKKADKSPEIKVEILDDDGSDTFLEGNGDPSEEPSTEDVLEIDIYDEIDDGGETPSENVDKKEKKEKKPRTYTAPKKKRDRSKETIEALEFERQQYLNELEALRKQNEELSSKIATTSKSNQEAMKAALEQSLDVLRSAMKDAIEKGEAEEHVKLNEEFFSVKEQLSSLNKEIETSAQQKKPQELKKDQKKKKEPSPAPVEIPDKAYGWIEAHPEFDEDPSFQRDAVYFSQVLLDEGYDMNDDVYYEMLDSRLEKLYPEAFSEDGDDNVEKEEKGQKSDKKGKPEQTVSSSSGVPSSGKRLNTQKKNTIKLSPKDVKQAKRWGLTLEQMARRISHVNNTKDSSGYTPIFIPKNGNR